MTYTLEDYLIQLHTGQWFGFDGDNQLEAVLDNVLLFSDIIFVDTLFGGNF